jgi:hypothetical protein
MLSRFFLNLSDPIKKNVYSFLNVIGVNCCNIAVLALNYFVSGNVQISSFFFAPTMQKLCVTIIALVS